MTKDLYKREAADYDRFVASSFPWRYVERPALDRCLKPLLQRGVKVLDVGCGTGRMTEYAVAHGVNPKDILGIDTSEAMLAIFRRTHPSVACRELNTSDPLLYRKVRGKFDVIVSGMTLFHLSNSQWRRALQNFNRLLKPGGALFYLVIHPMRLREKEYDRYFEKGWVVLDTKWGTKHRYFHRTLGDYINDTVGSGFTVIAVDEAPVTRGGKKYRKEYRKYLSLPHRLGVVAIKQ